MTLEAFIAAYIAEPNKHDVAKLQLFLEKNGFKYLNHGSFKTVYSKDRANYVVKISKQVDQGEFFQKFQPTTILQRKTVANHTVPNIYLDNNKLIMIQPKVKRAEYTDYKNLLGKLTKAKIQWTDDSTRNCGVYKNRPVVIDGCFNPIPRKKRSVKAPVK